MSRNPYFEHDDRGDIRKPMGRNRKYTGRNNARGPYHGGRPRYQDLDGDVDMSGPGGSWNNEKRFNPYKFGSFNAKRRRDKNRSYGKLLNYVDHSPENSWYKVSVPFGKKHGKQFVLKSIASTCKVPFVPCNFHFDGNNAVFFINDFAAAGQIRSSSRKVRAPDGFKLAVFVSNTAAPVTVMDDEVVQKIKESMSSCYDVASHSLNLGKFHYIPDLRTNGLYVPLNKANVLTAVVKIIKENIPEIESLDLTDNKLHMLEPLQALVPVCKQLTTLSLQNNRLKSPNQLNWIKGMNIINLVLDGNPLCDNFKEKAAYISAVRERLPKLMRLDGQELQAPIGFDLGAEDVPPSKGSFFIAEDVKALVVQFLEQYYTVYDSEDRGKLLDAYHEQAHFSLSVPRMTQPKHKEGLHQYVLESRNLLRVNDSGYRFKLLKQGRLAVVSALTNLPQTQHDPNSFSIDIFHVSPGLMSFSVTGVYKEVGDNIANQPLRTFHRTFIVVAHGEGGCAIINEMLFIANATPEQVKSFKFPAPTPSPSPAPSIPSVVEKSPSEKQQMVIEFVKLTGMNLDFSAKCLEENEWDYQKAATVFNELNNLGRIPAEAFSMKWGAT